MKAKMKKGIFWGGMLAFVVLILNVVHYLFGGASALAAGHHGHGPRGMGHHGDGFGPQQMMGVHHGMGFSWVWCLFFLILGMTAIVFVVKMLRKKSKEASMQQFIDTNLVSTHTSLMNQNENLLDQWEKNATKKENE
jgi:uncharacterized membrane protein